MARAGRRMKLSIFMGAGSFTWTWPTARHIGAMDFSLQTLVAQTAERAKLDFVFVPDSLAVGRGTDFQTASETGQGIGFEPLTTLAALSMVTKQIGLLATVSTTYAHPFHTARMLAALDHLSHGRIGWNVVTSSLDAEAHNFGLDRQLSGAERYERAEEFLTVAKGLWDSWDADAFPRDKASHRYYDPAKGRPLDHVGKHFKVRGPLNVPRMPQGCPVIAQAGASQAGFDLAARHANILYGSAASLPVAKEIYADVKGRAERCGRNPDHLNILPGILVVTGESLSEAEEKFDRVQSEMSFEIGRDLLTGYFLPGVDLSHLAPTDVVEFTPEIRAAAARSGFDLSAAGPEPTMRRLADWVGASYGHPLIFGTPSQVADVLESWFEEEGADGFNLWSHYLPGNFEEFATLVVPELQRRGLFQTEYSGGTLRDRLGIPNGPY